MISFHWTPLYIYLEACIAKCQDSCTGTNTLNFIKEQYYED